METLKMNNLNESRERKIMRLLDNIEDYSMEYAECEDFSDKKYKLLNEKILSAKSEILKMLCDSQ